MTLQDLGSLGEFVAAIATLATLAYLALQIRQNTQHVRASMHQQSYAAAQLANIPVYSDADLSDLVHRGLADPSELNEKERARFLFYAVTSIQAFETMYLQHRAGTLDQEFWEARIQLMRFWFAQPGIRACFEAASGSFARSFRDFLERDVVSDAAQQSDEDVE